MNTEFMYSQWMDQCELLVEEIRELQHMHSMLIYKTQELAERLGSPMERV